MMPRISKVFILLVLTAILAAFLPDLYWKVFSKASSYSTPQYSAVAGEFMIRTIDEHDRMSYTTQGGREIDREEYEINLPFFYIHDMQKWGRTPVEIDGLVYEAKQVQLERQFLRINPDMIGEPQIGLYPMFESQSKYAGLENPEEMFRVNDRLEFIRAEDNRVDEEMSALFTDKMKEKGFTFPAKYLAGNPTTRKPFDEGYFIVDSNNKIFQVKKIKGKPWCKDTGLAPPSGVKFMQISENMRKEFYGILIDGNNRVSLISYYGYELIDLPISEYYDPDRQSMFFIADPINRTLTFKPYVKTRDVTGDEKIQSVALDRNYNKVMDISLDMDRGSTDAARSFERVLFPFYLERSVPTSDYVELNVRFNGVPALIGIAISLILLTFWVKIRTGSIKNSWPELLFTAFTGVYGLIAVLIAGSSRNRRLTEN